MKVEAAHLWQVQGASRWQVAGPALAVCLAALLVLYWQTAAAMAAVWASSETYAHGWLIAPISLWLAWRRRGELARVVPAPDALGFALLAAAGLVWLLGTAGQAQVVQQFGLAAMVGAAVLALAGRRVGALLAFPLGFLLFAVPAGEGLLPRMMEFTADFTVAALRLTGIPVYREGNFFAIPSGQWSVVEACSGLRYLIASVTVGALYAYLTYRRFWKRALFVALSIAVPILANGLRAYLIVLIGHFSGMKLAVGIDHFIYGWVFFGVVIALLFWLGSFWREAPAPAAGPATSDRRAPAAIVTVLAAAGVLALGAAAPLYATYLERPAPARAPLALESPAAASGWTAQAPPAGWRPAYAGAAASAYQAYRKDGRTVLLHLARYRDQKQGAELIGAGNSLAGDAPWQAVAQGARREDLGAGPLELRETHLRAPGQRLLVWDWYRVSGRDFANPYLAKALLARDKLLGRGDEAAAVVLAAPYGERSDKAQADLRRFAREMLPAIHAALAASEPAP